MVPPRYVQNPLLLDGKKFDVRSYMLIACAMPYMVFFGHGYARLTLSLYNPHSSDLSGHLTNQVRTLIGEVLFLKVWMTSEKTLIVWEQRKNLVID